jgi:dUTP pyrophosphatase
VVSKTQLILPSILPLWVATLGSRIVTQNILKVQLLSPNATPPVWATKEAARLDLFSAEKIIIPPLQHTLVPTNIAVTPPIGTYCQIISRSGLLLNHQIEVKAGTIDRDYTRDVKVVLINTSNTPYTIEKGERIAQLVTYCIALPTPAIMQQLVTTKQNNQGFGITGHAQINILTPVMNTTPMLDTPTLPQPPNVHTITTEIHSADGIAPYNIWLSDDPFHH